MGVEPGLAGLRAPSERIEWQGDSMRRSFTIRCRVIPAAADAGMTTAEYAVGTLATCSQHISRRDLVSRAVRSLAFLAKSFWER